MRGFIVKKIITIILVIALLLLAYIAYDKYFIKFKVFNNESGIIENKRYNDFIILGRFGTKGPYRIRREESFDVDKSCHFMHGGTPHSYPAILGYRFIVLKMTGLDGKEGTIVLRTKEKEERKKVLFR